MGRERKEVSFRIIRSLLRLFIHLCFFFFFFVQDVSLIKMEI